MKATSSVAPEQALMSTTSTSSRIYDDVLCVCDAPTRALWCTRRVVPAPAAPTGRVDDCCSGCDCGDSRNHADCPARVASVVLCRALAFAMHHPCCTAVRMRHTLLLESCLFSFPQVSLGLVRALCRGRSTRRIACASCRADAGEAPCFRQAAYTHLLAVCTMLGTGVGTINRDGKRNDDAFIRRTAGTRPLSRLVRGCM